VPARAGPGTPGDRQLHGLAVRVRSAERGSRPLPLRLKQQREPSTNLSGRDCRLRTKSVTRPPSGAVAAQSSRSRTGWEARRAESPPWCRVVTTGAIALTSGDGARGAIAMADMPVARYSADHATAYFPYRHDRASRPRRAAALLTTRGALAPGRLTARSPDGALHRGTP
jgi:hypothetical protein